MRFSTEAVLWCMMQAGLLATMGSLAASLILRRRPAASAGVGAVAAASILAVTALAPIEWPSIPRRSEATVATAKPNTSDNASPAREDAAAIPSASGNGLNLGALWSALGQRLSVVRSAAAPRTSRLPAVVVGVVVTGAALGILRLGLSLTSVARIRRQCRAVDDFRVLRVVAELSDQWNLRRRVAVSETPAVTGPAVIGWRRPTVLLPASWREWNEANLRATLAHELAHVSRQDFAWRLTASLVRAIHFFNPLVHVLAQRLALAQEMAADRMAAAAVGGAAKYSRALADLALSLDHRGRTGCERILLPIFSSNLSRRMTMLRSKDGSLVKSRRSAIGLLAASLIVAAAVATTALRGGAADSTPSASARASDRAMFAGSIPDLSFMGRGAIGMAVVQTDDLAKMTELSFVKTVAEAFLQDAFDELKLKEGEAPNVRLEAIDYVAYSLRSASPEEAARTGSPGVGSYNTAICEMAIRWVEEIDAAGWLAKHVPNAVMEHEGGLSYVRVKSEEGSSKAGYAAQRDSHTLVVAYSLERLQQLLVRSDAAQADEAAKWDGVGGGVAALYLNTQLMQAREFIPVGPWLGLGASASPAGPDALAVAQEKIIENTDHVRAGVDINPATGQVALRLAFASGNETRAKDVEESVVMFREVAKAVLSAYTTELTAHPESLSEVEGDSRAYLDGLMASLQMISAASLEVRQRGATGADLWAEMGGELPESLRTYLNGGMPLTAVSSAKAPPAATAESTSAPAQLFARPPIMPVIPKGAKGGQFFVRVGELSARPELWAVVELAKSEARKHWREAFGAEAPEMDLSNVEYVAGLPELIIDGKKDPTQPASNGRLMMGVGGLVVHFKEDIDWRAWMRKYAPAAQEKTDKGLTYLELQLPAFGPEPMRWTARDGRTLVFAAGLDYLHQLVEARSSEAPGGVLGGWSALEGGLAAAVFGDARVDRSAKIPEAPQAGVVLENAKTFGVAFDLAPRANQAAIHLDLTCADRAAAELVNQAIQELLPKYSAAIEKELDARTDEERQFNRIWLEAIENCDTEIVSNDDGTVRVRLSASAKFPEYLARAVKVTEPTDAPPARR